MEKLRPVHNHPDPTAWEALKRADAGPTHQPSRSLSPEQLINIELGKLRRKRNSGTITQTAFRETRNRLRRLRENL